MPFSKNSYYIETSQLICYVNQLTDFYMAQNFTESYFQKLVLLKKSILRILNFHFFLGQSIL